MARMEHITVRLPVHLVEELRAEGEAAGAGMGWAIRNRLERRRWYGAAGTRNGAAIRHRGGGGKIPDGGSDPAE